MQTRKLFSYTVTALALVMGPAHLWAQTSTTILPDCMIFFNFAAVGNSPTSPHNGLDNRTLGCTTWQISYSNSGFSALSLILQSAPDSAGTPGTYGNFSGTVIVGSNPNTATTQAFTQFTGANPWVRVRLNSATGSGVVSGAAYGWRIPSANNVTPSGASTDVNLIKVGGATIALGQAAMAASIPVVLANNQTGLSVSGTAAAGAAPSGNPVQVGGTDGTNMRTLKTNTQGNELIGAYCTSQAAFNLSGSGNTQIIAAGAGTIHVCHISLATAAPEDIKLTSGTGANCATGTADVSGLYKTISALALDTLGALVAPANAALCLNQSAVQATGGIVIYSVF